MSKELAPFFISNLQNESSLKQLTKYEYENIIPYFIHALNYACLLDFVIDSEYCFSDFRNK